MLPAIISNVQRILKHLQMLGRVLAMGSVLALLAVIGTFAGENSQDNLDNLKRDLNELQTAINLGKYDQVYSDFLTARCRSKVSRQEFVALFGGPGPREIQVQVQEPRNVRIQDDRAEFDLTTVAQGPPRQDELSAHMTFVEEDGHWRDSNCLGAGK